MYLVDSDLDTEDEAFADDIEEVISNHVLPGSDDDAVGDGTSACGNEAKTGDQLLLSDNNGVADA